MAPAYGPRRRKKGWGELGVYAGFMRLIALKTRSAAAVNSGGLKRALA
jgi:hypothetical protein